MSGTRIIPAPATTPVEPTVTYITPLNTEGIFTYEPVNYEQISIKTEFIVPNLEGSVTNPVIVNLTDYRDLLSWGTWNLCSFNVLITELDNNLQAWFRITPTFDDIDNVSIVTLNFMCESGADFDTAKGILFATFQKTS
jgi:hypothetical protein